MRCTELVELTAELAPSCGPVRVVAVDGGAGAGKTTLAGRLAHAHPRARVLHLDELLDGWAGQFGYRDRLHEQVFRPLADGQPARYQRYDWTREQFADWVELPVPDLLIVEGVSAVWGCDRWLGLGVFLALDRMDRLRRWIERDGPAQPEWLAWLEAEDAFFGRHPVSGDRVRIVDGGVE